MSTRMYDIHHPNTARCNHILDTNLQCQSPALRGKSFCYWHEQNRKHRDKFTVPLLETELAIQATLSEVLRELHEGKIDTKRANSMFYGLSLAMYNVRRISFSTDRDHVIDLPEAMKEMLDHVPGEDDVRQLNFATSAPSRTLRGTEPPPPSDDSAPEEAKLSALDDAIPEARKSGAPNDVTYEVWKSGALAPRCDAGKSGALASVPSAELPPSTIDHLPSSSIDSRTSSFIKKVLRAGPSHPKFAEVSRLYDRYISSKQAG